MRREGSKLWLLGAAAALVVILTLAFGAWELSRDLGEGQEEESSQTEEPAATPAPEQQGDFTVAENYIRFLSDRIRFLNNKIGGLLISGAGTTFRYWLMNKARTADGKLYVDVDVSMSALAEMLNMGRASLYRSIDDLEREGLIKKEGRRIYILKPENLFPERE